MLTVKKFYGTFCQPCKVLAPIMNEVKGNFPNVRFEDYDVDEYENMAAKYGVRSVPTVVIENNGKEVGRLTGVQSKMTYVNILNENLTR